MSLNLHNGMTLECINELRDSYRCATSSRSQADKDFYRRIINEYLRLAIEDDNCALKGLLPDWLGIEAALRCAKFQSFYLDTYIDVRKFVGNYPVRNGRQIIRVLLAHATFVARLKQSLESLNIPRDDLDMRACELFIKYVDYKRYKLKDRFKKGLTEHILADPIKELVIAYKTFIDIVYSNELVDDMPAGM